MPIFYDLIISYMSNVLLITVTYHYVVGIRKYMVLVLRNLRIRGEGFIFPIPGCQATRPPHQVAETEALTEDFNTTDKTGITNLV